MRKGILVAGCSVGLGAGLMYVLDPDRGRRRRALLRERSSHVVRESLLTLGKKARDIGNRARGLVAETGTHLRCEQVSDGVLVKRVRSKMGRAVSEPGDIEVLVSEGQVTLRGVVFDREADRLLRCVARVRGVRGVENQLKVKRRHGETLKAGRENGSGDGKHADGSRHVPGRLLATLAGSGLALYGAKRRGVFGPLVSVMGVRMLRRGLFGSESHPKAAHDGR